jgi:hypothetical protein
VSRQRAVVVELVGPAGAGKSTLAQGVTAVDATVRSGLSLWGVPRRRLVRSAVALLPTIARAGLHRTPLRAGEMSQMVRLDALRRIVEHEVAEHRVILLEEGPVFALSWLEVFFSRNGDRVPASWRHRVVHEWANLLDVVVFIDASDIKAAGNDGEIVGFSAGFRRAFERALAELAQAGGDHLVVDTLKTGQAAIDEDTARLMAKLKQRRNGH